MNRRKVSKLIQTLNSYNQPIFFLCWWPNRIQSVARNTTNRTGKEIIKFYCILMLRKFNFVPRLSHKNYFS